MKKLSILQIIGLCLPVVFVVVVGILVGGYRERKRKERIAYYSQPYVPQLKVRRAEVPKGGDPGLFEARARCMATGGSKQSQWLVRGQMFDVSGKAPREIWNSQKAPKSVSFIGNIQGPFWGGSNEEADFSWRFSRDPKDKRQFKFVVEAVAIPIYVPEDKLGSAKISAKEATPTQIAGAKQLPGAKYFRDSIELKPSDDSKHQTQPLP